MAPDPLLDADAGWGSIQVAEAAGLAYQTLHRWCAAGAVQPSIADAAGTGTRRRWSELDMAVLCRLGTVADDMHDLGFNRLPIEFVARLWDAMHVDPGSDVVELEAGTVIVSVRCGLEGA